MSSAVVRRSLIVCLLAANGVAFLRADETTSPAAVARLVADLASDSRAVRARAEVDLIQLGPAVIDLLPTTSASDPAVRDSLDRVVRAIDQAEFAAALTPLPVHWTKAPDLRQAIQQLATASGNSLEASALDSISLTEPFPTQPLTFWQAINWIEHQTSLRYSKGRLTSPLPDKLASKNVPTSLSGPFRVQLISSVVRTTASGSRLLGLKLRTMCEPKLRPLFLMAGVDDWQLKSGGTAIPAFTPHARLELPAGQEGVIELSFDFVLPPPVTDRPLQLSGSLDLTLAAKTTSVTFSDLAAPLPLTRRRGQASLSLLSVKSRATSCTVRVAAAFPEMSGLFESYRASLLAPELTLELSTGGKLSLSDSTQIQEDSHGIVIETRFESDQTTGARLHARVPAAISTQKILFDFPEVSLTDTPLE